MSRNKWLLIGVFVFGAIVPYIADSDPYWLSLLSKLYINAMFGLSMWPLFLIGRLTLAHAAFYGFGAYGVSLLMLRLGWSFWIAMPVGMILVAAAAALFGWPTLRIRAIAFVIATFAFAEVGRLIYLRFDNPFGGAQGLFGVPGVSPLPLPFVGEITFTSFISQYYLMLGFLALLTLVYYRMMHSYLGLVIRSIRDANQLTKALGVNVFAYEMVTFVVTGVGAAVAGGLYATWAHYLEPNLFHFGKSIDPQAYVVVGGASWALGPLFGAAFMTFMPEYLNLAREAAPIITGSALLICMFFVRGGLVTLPNQTRTWLTDLKNVFVKREPVPQVRTEAVEEV